MGAFSYERKHHQDYNFSIRWSGHSLPERLSTNCHMQGVKNLQHLVSPVGTPKRSRERIGGVLGAQPEILDRVGLHPWPSFRSAPPSVHKGKVEGPGVLVLSPYGRGPWHALLLGNMRSVICEAAGSRSAVCSFVLGGRRYRSGCRALDLVLPIRIRALIFRTE